MTGTENVKQNPEPREPSSGKSHDPSFQDGLDFFKVLIMVASILFKIFMCTLHPHKFTLKYIPLACR